MRRSRPACRKATRCSCATLAVPPPQTGSLYNFRRIAKSTIADGEWSRHTIAVIGNRILIQTNSELHVDYTDKESTYTEGHIALQQHDQASQVNF